MTRMHARGRKDKPCGVCAGEARACDAGTGQDCEGGISSPHATPRTTGISGMAFSGVYRAAKGTTHFAASRRVLGQRFLD